MWNTRHVWTVPTNIGCNSEWKTSISGRSTVDGRVLQGSHSHPRGKKLDGPKEDLNLCEWLSIYTCELSIRAAHCASARVVICMIVMCHYDTEEKKEFRKPFQRLIESHAWNTTSSRDHSQDRARQNKNENSPKSNESLSSSSLLWWCFDVGRQVIHPTRSSSDETGNLFSRTLDPRRGRVWTSSTKKKKTVSLNTLTPDRVRTNRMASSFKYPIPRPAE